MTAHQKTLRQSVFCFLPCFFFFLFTVLSVRIGCSALLCALTLSLPKRCGVPCCSSPWGCEPCALLLLLFPSGRWEPSKRLWKGDAIACKCRYIPEMGSPVPLLTAVPCTAAELWRPHARSEDEHGWNPLFCKGRGTCASGNAGSEQLGFCVPAEIEERRGAGAHVCGWAMHAAAPGTAWAFCAGQRYLCHLLRLCTAVRRGCFLGRQAGVCCHRESSIAEVLSEFLCAC